MSTSIAVARLLDQMEMSISDMVMKMLERKVENDLGVHAQVELGPDRSGKVVWKITVSLEDLCQVAEQGWKLLKYAKAELRKLWKIEQLNNPCRIEDIEIDWMCEVALEITTRDDLYEDDAYGDEFDV